MPWPSPSVALLVHAEPLVDGARVLFIGRQPSAVVEHCRARGAHSVNVWQLDEINADTQASRAPASVKNAQYDLVVVEDLQLLKHPAGLIATLRRSLSRRGAALIGCSNREVTALASPGDGQSEVDYYGLYDLVRDHFPVVRMLGQAPFVGYAIADFASDDAPSPQVDTTLLEQGAEEPEFFVALGSFEPKRLEAFSLVQLPIESGSAGVSEALSSRSRAISELEEVRQALESAKLREASLLGDLARKERELETERQKAARLINDVEAVRLEAEQTRQKEAKLRADRESDQRELAAMASRLDESHGLAERVAERIAELESLRETQAARINQLERERESQAARIAEVEAELQTHEQRWQRIEGIEPVDVEEEYARLERLLMDQGERTRKLEAELAEARTVGRGLALDLESLMREQAALASAGEVPTAGDATPSHEADDELSVRLREAERRIAEREADNQVLLWTLEQMEDRLERAGIEPAETPLS